MYLAHECETKKKDFYYSSVKWIDHPLSLTSPSALLHPLPPCVSHTLPPSASLTSISKFVEGSIKAHLLEVGDQFVVRDPTITHVGQERVRGTAVQSVCVHRKALHSQLVVRGTGHNRDQLAPIQAPVARHVQAIGQPLQSSVRQFADGFGLRRRTRLLVSVHVHNDQLSTYRREIEEMGTTLTVGDFHYDITTRADLRGNYDEIAYTYKPHKFGGIARANITHEK